ncbi:MAG TPA: tRNA (adenosine(37)-N6)-threonylcarbamoyltransferase complex ATPase subunit type 1 TsaE [Burkholderiales bacterium]|nr:tRNA (adenosine(37)-N6)-threonylcarbamoyltransferase complex ATPase subunit type 1 TsaE [Burkholderiales bacterium]
MADYHKRHLAEAQDTLALGAALARGLRPGMVVHLRGELGAGKTTLVRGILRGLGWRGLVKSPTFTLLEPYLISSLYLYHFDFYRFGHLEEWEDTGFREYFNPTSICLIEWPEKAGESLPEPDVEIALTIDGNGRDAEVVAHTEAGRDCITRLQN